jgi:hypothetical protein
MVTNPKHLEVRSALSLSPMLTTAFAADVADASVDPA